MSTGLRLDEENLDQDYSSSAIHVLYSVVNIAVCYAQGGAI